MRKGFLRGLIIGVILSLIVLTYIWLRYDTAAPEWTLRLSNALFSIGLLTLIGGVIVFTRLFSYRRRMGLVNYTAWMRFRTREEAEQFKKDEEELNEQDREAEQEGLSRDISLLIAALVLIAASILLTV
jgi:Ca2+/Na+ antiporter